MLRIQISSFKDPLLFLYILSVIYSNFKLKAKHLVHILPWLINMLVLFPVFFMVSENEKLLFLNHYSETSTYLFSSKLDYILSIAYLVAEIYYLFRYRKLLLENYTNKIYFYNYNWLKQLILFIIVGQILTTIKGFLRDNNVVDIANNAKIVLLLFGLIFSFWLVFKALYSPKLFRGIDVNLRLSKEMINEKGKNNENFSKEESHKIEQLKEYMIAKEPFLESSLTIQDLALKLNLNSRDLSVLINQSLNKHFFDFINEYRIEKAKKLLKDTSKKELTVLEILYEVGFNSKSSFNTAFKKHTGITPTQFRKIAD